MNWFGVSISDTLLSEWWDVWSTRILVTLVLIVLLDYLNLRPTVAFPQQQVNQTYDEVSAARIQFYESIVEKELHQKDKKTIQEDSIEANGCSSISKPQLSSSTSNPIHIINEKQDERATGCKKREKSESNTPMSRFRSDTTSTITTNGPTGQLRTPPPIAARTNMHPGMESFWNWYDAETSLYRIYTFPRSDGVEVAPPYVPHSYRGQVRVQLRVQNRTNRRIQVYWVDYKGKHVHKGTIKPNQLWTQTTWIDHPWVFEGEADAFAEDSGNSSLPTDTVAYTPYLYYIPYRVIPTLPEVPTVQQDDPEIGIHEFDIVPPNNALIDESSATPSSLSSSPLPSPPQYYIGVEEKVLPYPPQQHLKTPLEGIAWTLQHMSRYVSSGRFHWKDPCLNLLQKYLTNIINSPENVKYRQLRIGSDNKFGPNIWNNVSCPALQGLLLAVGFVQVTSGYVELGCSNFPLSRERIQDIALLSYLLAKWKKEEQVKEEKAAVSSTSSMQPEGADGFGRAGYGRAGNMNLGSL